MVRRKTGVLSNQGEKSINFYFVRVPLRKKVLKHGTPKPRRLSDVLCCQELFSYIAGQRRWRRTRAWPASRKPNRPSYPTSGEELEVQDDIGARPKSNLGINRVPFLV